jgi:hypothetical protein
LARSQTTAIIDVNLYDRKGIPMMLWDVVKVFHYVAARRRKKRYMYKQVVGFCKVPLGGVMLLSHLNGTCETYRMLMDGRTLDCYEIVQGYTGVERGQDFTDRPRRKT